jgi:sister-chromatid-cohesion protein PDS5
MIFKVLSNLSDVKNPLFSYYFYLLESTSTIKSVVLLGDLGADSLVLCAFEDFFQMISPEMSLSIQVCVRDILYQLIEEIPFVQQGNPSKLR